MIVLSLILGYFLCLFVSTILSFATKTQPTRRIARVTASILGGLLLLVVSGLWLTFRLIFPEPPSISTLAKHFAERRSTLEQIIAMSDQDKYFFRIDPTFLDYDYTQGKMDGKAVVGDAAAKMAPARLKAYRTLFAKAKLDQGFQRQPDGDIYFMAGSVGILDNGHTTGYLYCRDPGSPTSQSSGYQPCKSVTVDHGSQTYSDNPRREAYSFKKVAEHWFVLDQGPS